MVGRHWSFGDSRRGSLYRCRSDHGRTSRSGGRRGCGWFNSGALIGMGIPEYEAKRYEGKIKEGNILISVHSENSDEVTRAKDIFERNGAHDISYTEEKGVPKQEQRRA